MQYNYTFDFIFHKEKWVIYAQWVNSLTSC